jgi:hypothetical protein
VFFKEKTIGVNQFIIQSKEILEKLFIEINNKLILQGLTIEKRNDIINTKIDKYINKVIKYINKKEKPSTNYN